MSRTGCTLKIERLDAIPLRIPFSHGAAAASSGGQAWTALEILLVRIETNDGLTGWGEAFSYSCQKPVQSALEMMVAPLVVGREVTDVPTFMHELQRTLHLFGRYGITLFALSGMDIALWDLAAKAVDMPLRSFINANALETPLPRMPAFTAIRFPSY